MSKMGAKNKKGFTIIEVTLFLAVTGLMIMGVVGALIRPIQRQRYQDALRGLEEYLVTAYSAVINPATMGSDTVERIRGASDEVAIYGKLLVFGLDEDEDRVYHATIVGAVNPPTHATSFISDLNSVLNADGGNEYGLFCGSEDLTNTFATTVDSYAPLWQTKINNVSGGTFRGAVIIARSPSTSTIHTAYYDMNDNFDYKFPLNENCQRASTELREAIAYDSRTTTFEEHFKTTQPVELCLRAHDVPIVRKIEIAADGHNTSAISLVDETEIEQGRIVGCR